MSVRNQPFKQLLGLLWAKLDRPCRAARPAAASHACWPLATPSNPPAGLQGLNGELQSQLITREREVERLKLALDVVAEKTMGSHGSSPRWVCLDACVLAWHSLPWPIFRPRNHKMCQCCACLPAVLVHARQHCTAHLLPSLPLATTCAACSTEGADGTTEPAALLNCSDGDCVECDVLPADLAGIDFKKGFSDQVALLRGFLEQHGLAEGAGEHACVQGRQLGGKARDMPEQKACCCWDRCAACLLAGLSVCWPWHTPPFPPLLCAALGCSALLCAGCSLSKDLSMQLAQLVGRSCQLCQVRRLPAVWRVPLRR